VRASGDVQELSPSEIAKWCEEHQGRRPKARLALPMKLSQRPTFRG